MSDPANFASTARSSTRFAYLHKKSKRAQSRWINLCWSRGGIWKLLLTNNKQKHWGSLFVSSLHMPFSCGHGSHKSEQRISKQEDRVGSGCSANPPKHKVAALGVRLEKQHKTKGDATIQSCFGRIISLGYFNKRTKPRTGQTAAFTTVVGVFFWWVSTSDRSFWSQTFSIQVELMWDATYLPQNDELSTPTRATCYGNAERAG